MSDKPTRCYHCKKKQILLFDCHCNYVFCIRHRMPEDHSCSYDYKKEGKKMLEQNNPKITFQKLEKI